MRRLRLQTGGPASGLLLSRMWRPSQAWEQVLPRLRSPTGRKSIPAEPCSCSDSTSRPELRTSSPWSVVSATPSATVWPYVQRRAKNWRRSAAASSKERGWMLRWVCHHRGHCPPLSHRWGLVRLQQRHSFQPCHPDGSLESSKGQVRCIWRDISLRTSRGWSQDASRRWAKA